jgi:hypothetical protein
VFYLIKEGWEIWEEAHESDVDWITIPCL